VLVEINVNHNRCGVTPSEAPALAASIVALHAAATAAAGGDASKALGVRFVGLQGYEGHTPVLERAAKTAATSASHSIIADAKARVQAAGVSVEHVCGGGSCNYMVRFAALFNTCSVFL
jgi:D-serine deaminase-like pyridoxal phosphate-dependent protein